MSETSHDRRTERRRAGGQAVSVLAKDQSFPAIVADMSDSGLQVHLDAITFDEIRESIEAVRFGTFPPLSITLHWGFFDGTFGASFNDRQSAQPIVERIMAETADDMPASLA